MSSLSAASSAAGLLGAGRLSISGLASGLDTAKIVEGLLAIQAKRIEQLESKQTRAQAQQSAYKGIEARLLALQGHLSQLARAQNGAFDARTATSSNTDILTAAASSSAAAGVYQVQVNSLAKAHQIIGQGYDSLTSSVTQGTLQIRVGSGATTTVTIDASNNTLQGLAGAINSAGAGVTASVINDGSAANTQPYRLLLTSNSTGASNTITITNNLAADSGSAVKPIFDSKFVGAANVGTGYTGTSTPTSNRGAGGFTGTANNTYTFTVVTGGTVGIGIGLQIAYTDASGANTGTITLGLGDVDTFKTVAQGIQVKFGAGTLVAGETFTIDGFVPQVQAGADASVTVGSGVGAITVNSAKNQIDGIFNGLTLNLQSADPTKVVTVSVANDAAKVKQNITDFVNSYNDLLKFISEQTAYDPDSNEAGILLGDVQVRNIEQAVRNAMTRPIEGLPTQMNRLSALGITPTDQGRLTINQAKLDDALAGRLIGVSFNDVRRLFALGGVSSLPGIEFVTASAKTKSSATPYQVTVTQAAEQASITATNSLAASTVLTSSNNTFTINVDGVTSSTITLPEGTYTRLALAQAVEAQINASTSLAGRRVAASLVGDKLAITSSAYGSTSKVAIGTGTALSPMGFVGIETDQGVNVAGSYTVGGLTEAATGAGQLLAGLSTNPNTAELQVRVTLTPTQVGGGVTGNLTVTRGVASNVDLSLASLLEPVTGRMKTIDDGFQTRVDDIKNEIVRQNELMEAKRQSLLQRFVALERTLSQLQGLGNFLNTQFSQLAALNTRR